MGYAEAMSRKIPVSTAEKVVNQYILAQMGLRGENAASISKKLDRSYPYVRDRTQGRKPWAISDIEAFSHLWGIPVKEFFSDSVSIRPESKD